MPTQDAAQVLQGQVAIVVGASSGMGRATAMALAQAGAHVIAAARRIDRLDELAKPALSATGTIETCQVDTTNSADVERMIDGASQRTGRIDLLVYAAGTNLPERGLPVLTLQSWQHLIETNLTGAFLCTRAVLPVMRAARNGLIVYLSSACVQMPDVSGVAYQASKHGMVGLAHGTRIEEKANGIRTSVIFPGLCDTEILNRRPVPTPRDVLDLALAPEDVAEAVLFLAGLPPRAVVPELQILPSRL
jgi:serine 3-dehydrogenase